MNGLKKTDRNYSFLKLKQNGSPTHKALIVMDAKQKALELFHKFAKQWHASTDDVKLNCLICVDEIIKHKPILPYTGGYYEIISDRTDEVSEYWEQVKQAINEL